MMVQNISGSYASASLLASVCLLACAGRTLADPPVDLQLIGVDNVSQVGIRSWQPGDPVPGGGPEMEVVGLTFNTLAQNVGPNPIPWYYPVNETTQDPWVQANGFQGQEGSANHFHDSPPVSSMNNQVGRHPHIQFFVYRQARPGALTIRIGQSDLKHTYRAVPPGHHHELAPGIADSYAPKHNQDQSFFGPVSEMNPATYIVGAHEHMGSLHPELGPGYWRDHGENAFGGAGSFPADAGHPGETNIDHLLQAPLGLMIPPVDSPQPRWFLAATYYAVGDTNMANNSRWTEIFPQWDGSSLTFATGTTGLGLDTIPGVNIRSDIAIDSLRELDVHWFWSPQSAAASYPSTINWLAAMTIDDGGENWNVRWKAFNRLSLLDPSVEYLISKTDGAGRIVDDMFCEGTECYHFTIDRDLATGDFAMELSAVSTVPEPSTIMLAVFGSVGLLALRRRKHLC